MTSAEGPFQYSRLGADQKRQIIDSRLAQYEAEHYAQSLNRRTLERAVDVTDQEKDRQLEQIDRTLASIESSIELHRQELAELS
jgi:hypothetical protein